ncbi:hypothetical protein E5288_WYG014237 [Bos mutus]|uniref:Uncharacterized protein n=1 Tax=Bos mutus TaxID=72004 RepID=A0A6B0R3W1_9CETA|nr:hypothetical protein [Bos mutus]
MNTVLSRANSLFAFSLSVMAALTFGCFITTAFKDRSVPVRLHVSRIMLCQELSTGFHVYEYAIDTAEEESRGVVPAPTAAFFVSPPVVGESDSSTIDWIIMGGFSPNKALTPPEIIPNISKWVSNSLLTPLLVMSTTFHKWAGITNLDAYEEETGLLDCWGGLTIQGAKQEEAHPLPSVDKPESGVIYCASKENNYLQDIRP